MAGIRSRIETAWALFRARVRGWRCRRRIVVIESDDWGSIRTSSRAAYDRLLALGYRMEASPFSLDCLETDEDLVRLYEVLGSVRDSRGRPACMTANTILANPDFERIKASGFREYHYEPVDVTLARSPERRGVARLWAEGFAQRLVVPQLHAREHVRSWEWLDTLRAGGREALETFEMGMCGVPMGVSKVGQSFFAPQYLDGGRLSQARVDLEVLIRDAARLFQERFGFRSLTVVAPNYCWTDSAERFWAAEGIRFIQGGVFQHCDLPGGARRRPHYCGEFSRAGPRYLVRNCCLETTHGGETAAAACLREVARAFRFRTPAVIGTHRVNFVGSISPENRRNGLNSLARVLESTMRKWPDAIFLSSPELGFLIEHGDGALESLGESAIVGGGPGCG
jgi:hypothetical protein